MYSALLIFLFSQHTLLGTPYRPVWDNSWPLWLCQSCCPNTVSGRMMATWRQLLSAVQGGVVRRSWPCSPARPTISGPCSAWPLPVLIDCSTCMMSSLVRPLPKGRHPLDSHHSSNRNHSLQCIAGTPVLLTCKIYKGRAETSHDVIAGGSAAGVSSAEVARITVAPINGMWIHAVPRG